MSQTRRIRPSVRLLAAALGLVGASALAATPLAPVSACQRPSTQSFVPIMGVIFPDNRADLAFLAQASRIAYDQGEAGRLAADASTPEIHAYALRVWKTGISTAATLDGIAQLRARNLAADMDRFGVALPSQQAWSAQDDSTRAFLDRQQSITTQEVAIYRDELAQGRDPLLRRFAQAQLPELVAQTQVVAIAAGHLDESIATAATKVVTKAPSSE